MTSNKCSVMSVKEYLEGRVIRPGTSVKENERSWLASREVQYSIKDARDGSVAKVALQCTDVRTRMSDNVTLCSPVMGVRDRVNGSFREGRNVCSDTSPTCS